MAMFIQKLHADRWPNLGRKIRKIICSLPQSIPSQSGEMLLVKILLFGSNSFH